MFKKILPLLLIVLSFAPAAAQTSKLDDLCPIGRNEDFWDYARVHPIKVKSLAGEIVSGEYPIGKFRMRYFTLTLAQESIVPKNFRKKPEGEFAVIYLQCGAGSEKRDVVLLMQPIDKAVSK